MNNLPKPKLNNEAQDKKYDKFGEQLKKAIMMFENIHDIENARALANKMFDIHKGVNYINRGNVYCTISNKDDYLRIVANSKEEITIFNFNKNKN